MMLGYTHGTYIYTQVGHTCYNHAISKIYVSEPSVDASLIIPRAIADHTNKFADKR